MNQPAPEKLEDRHWQTIQSLGQIDSDAVWDSILALREAGTSRVLERALQWCQAPDAYRRSVGVSVLAQLGPDTKAFPMEASAMILQMIATERDYEVVTSLISAVHFRELDQGVPWLISLSEDPSEDIRWRVAWALPIPNANESPTYRTSIETLLKLINDTDSRVRDWATFSISMTQEDSAEIREALLARLGDRDFDTRSEAAVGLARRKVHQGIDPLISHLQSDCVGELYVEAAELYADTRLKPALLSLRRWWDVNPELLERAIAACS
jgi:hypothetical protein